MTKRVEAVRHPNSLTCELSDDSKQKLAAEFARLAVLFPPVRFERRGGWTFTVPLTRAPWKNF